MATVIAKIAKNEIKTARWGKLQKKCSSDIPIHELHSWITHESASELSDLENVDERFEKLKCGSFDIIDYCFPNALYFALPE